MVLLTFSTWSSMMIGPTKTRTVPKNTINTPATMKPAVSLALFTPMTVTVRQNRALFTSKLQPSGTSELASLLLHLQHHLHTFMVTQSPLLHRFTPLITVADLLMLLPHLKSISGDAFDARGTLGNVVHLIQVR